MPNPKSGTVTLDVANAVKLLRAGQIELSKMVYSCPMRQAIV